MLIPPKFDSSSMSIVCWNMTYTSGIIMAISKLKYQVVYVVHGLHGLIFCSNRTILMDVLPTFIISIYCDSSAINYWSLTLEECTYLSGHSGFLTLSSGFEPKSTDR